MPWWGWALVAWAVLATAGGFVLGAVAAKARRRERAMRARWYAETPPDYVPGPPEEVRRSRAQSG